MSWAGPPPPARCGAPPALLPIVETFLQIGNAVFPIITALLPPLIQLLGPILTPIIAILTGVLQALKPVLDIIGAAVSWVSGILQILGQVFSGVVQTVVALMKGDLSAIPGIWSGIWSAVQGIVASTWNNIVGFIESGVNAIIGLINGMIAGFNDVAGNFGLSIPTIGRVNWSGVKLAEGGVVMGRTIAEIGEGRYHEVVQPIGGPKFEQFVDSIAERLQPQEIERERTMRLHPSDLRALGKMIARSARGYDHMMGEA